MLGLKIAVTAFVLAVLSSAVIGLIGKKMPSLWVAWPLMLLFYGGAATTVGGFLWWVWNP